MRKDVKKGKMMIGLLLLIGVIGIGYAALGANLKINGVANISSASWDVHFKSGSIAVTSGSVTGTNVTTAATITNATQVDYAVKLALPGDFYEFTVTAENTGSIDAMIDSVSSKLGTTEITTGTLPSYIDYSVTYADGITISPKHLLAASTEETYKVRIAYKTDIEASELPSEAVTLNLNFQINYVQADDTATSVPRPVSFADDSWDTIISAAQNGNTSAYTVGSTKTVDMGIFGTHTLRVANNSTPAECSTAGFSQTACGFVLEFVDIIAIHQMNLSGSYDGGWEYSEMRTYVNNDIFNALPTVLKDGIIDTMVVSGHENQDSGNYITVDKLYLLSPHEVWENANGTTTYDTSFNNTRQLDYYAGLNVTSLSLTGAIKQYNNINTGWWLRSVDTDYCWFIIDETGDYQYEVQTGDYGASPAFRIA